MKTDIEKLEDALGCQICNRALTMQKLVNLLKRERAAARNTLLTELGSSPYKTDRAKIKTAMFEYRELRLAPKHENWLIDLLKRERAKARKEAKPKRRTSKIRKGPGRQLEI
jgi:hypothetical protein